MLSAGKFRGSRPLREVIELAVRCLAHALVTGSTPSSAGASSASGLFETLTLVGYSVEEQTLLTELGRAVGKDLAAGASVGGADPRELFVHPFNVASEAARMVELCGAVAASDAERVRIEGERRELEERASGLAKAQAVLQTQERTLKEAQTTLALEAGATAEQRKVAEEKLLVVREQEAAARLRLQAEEQTLKAAIKAAEAAAEAQQAKIQVERAAADAEQAKAADEKKAAETQKAAAEKQQAAAEVAKAAAEAAKKEAETAAEVAKAEADKALEQSSTWLRLNGGISTFADVEKLFSDRQPVVSGHPKLQIESAVCLANERALGSFVSAGGFDLTPVRGHSTGDTLLFHGTNEAAVANIQATGRPTMQFAANGNLGRGIYGAPDPRKSLGYASGRHGKFMFICRFNLQGARDGNWGLDEFAVYNDNQVVVLWMLKVRE